MRTLFCTLMSPLSLGVGFWNLAFYPDPWSTVLGLACVGGSFYWFVQSRNA